MFFYLMAKTIKSSSFITYKDKVISGLSDKTKIGFHPKHQNFVSEILQKISQAKFIHTRKTPYGNLLPILIDVVIWIPAVWIILALVFKTVFLKKLALFFTILSLYLIMFIPLIPLFLEIKLFLRPFVSFLEIAERESQAELDLIAELKKFTIEELKHTAALIEEHYQRIQDRCQTFLGDIGKVGIIPFILTVGVGGYTLDQIYKKFFNVSFFAKEMGYLVFCLLVGVFVAAVTHTHTTRHAKRAVFLIRQAISLKN